MLINEDAMNVLRHREDKDSAERMSRLSRWHTVISSDLIKGYGGIEVQVTQAARVLAQGCVPNEVFKDPRPSVFSLGSSVMDTLCEGA